MALRRSSNYSCRIRWKLSSRRVGLALHWSEPVARGIPRYWRHPGNVTTVLLFLGVSAMSASWVFLVLTIIAGVGFTRPYLVKIEEAQCLGRFGVAYREYMNRIPGWIGLPKSKKND